MISNTTLSSHLALVTDLIGTQKGKLIGLELFFTTHQYAKNNLNKVPGFYKEAICKMTQLDIRKQITDIREENVFFNPIFTTNEGKVLHTSTPNYFLQIYKYGTLLDEHSLRLTQQQYRKRITNIFDKIAHVDNNDREHFTLLYNGTTSKCDEIAQKVLYELVIKGKHYKDHHSSASWSSRIECFHSMGEGLGKWA